MLDICYYNGQVKEEIDGAFDYIKRAINYKKENPSRASQFSKMASMELDHASTLMNMFEQDYKDNLTDDPIYEGVHQTLTDMYTEYVAKVKYMMDIYDKT